MTYRAGARKNVIRAILFDLDGVLIDSTPCHRAAFERVFKDEGIRDFDYSKYAGWRTADVVADVFRRSLGSADPEKVAYAGRRKSELALQMIAERKPLVDGCPAVLEALSRRYRLALASSGSRASVNLFLDLSGSRNLFDTVLCGDDVTHAKPHPEIYLRAIANLGLESQACVVIEDAVAGVEAARGAGAQVIGVAGTCTAEELIRAGAAQVVSSLLELEASLEKLVESEKVEVGT